MHFAEVQHVAQLESALQSSDASTLRNRLNKLDEDVDAVMSLVEAGMSYQANLGCEDIAATRSPATVHEYVRSTRELINNRVVNDAIHAIVT